MTVPKWWLSSRTFWWFSAAALGIEIMIQAGVMEGWQPRIGQAVAALGLWLRAITRQPVRWHRRRGLVALLLLAPMLAGCEWMRVYW